MQNAVPVLNQELNEVTYILGQNNQNKNQHQQQQQKQVTNADPIYYTVNKL